MPIFAVFPFSNHEKLGKAIEDLLPDGSKALPRGCWLVAFAGTAAELAAKLGITPDGENGTGIVLSVGSYYGRAPVDNWEWLESRWEK